jgi:hypothetical protein
VASKDGHPIVTTAYEVSADGRTLTITGEHQRIVLARVTNG